MVTLHRNGVDTRPTIAITKAHIQMLELVEAIDKGRLVADGKLLTADGSVLVTKAAIEHVWHLPGKPAILFRRLSPRFLAHRGGHFFE